MINIQSVVDSVIFEIEKQQGRERSIYLFNNSFI